jgi:hypothetical protein
MTTEYIVIIQQIVGTPEDYRFTYWWDGQRYPSTGAAVEAGSRATRSSGSAGRPESWMTT